MRVITHIVLHTAASARNGQPVHQSIEDIRRYHVNHNMWTDIGYHYYLTEDGKVHEGRDPAIAGAHVGGFNKHTLGVCVSGHGDLGPWNESQVKGVVELCAYLCRSHNLRAGRVIGHNECGDANGYDGPPIYKTCPGKLVDMSDIRKRVNEALQDKQELTLEERVSALEWRTADLERRFGSISSTSLPIDPKDWKVTC